MKVLAWVHMGPPHHNAGAELMLQALMRDLATKGHEVRVLLARTPEGMYVHEGVTYSPGFLSAEVERWYRWCDVAITHLDMTRQAVDRAKQHDKPIVHIVHNDRQLRFHGVEPGPSQLVVFNSRWIAEKVAWRGRHVVVRPPVFADEYKIKHGDALTLVNLSPSKGSEIFYELARRLPDVPFLGVKGAYGRQMVPPPGMFPNLTVIGNTPSMRDDVYARTRVLLMPSDYESWGRVAIEAAASGIPTIAHPTPGLQEALGSAGIFVDRDDVDGWVWALKKLDDPKSYSRQATAARRRSRGLDPTDDLALFEKSLVELIG